MDDQQPGTSNSTKDGSKRIKLSSSDAEKKKLQDIAVRFIHRDGIFSRCVIEVSSNCKYFQTVLNMGNFIRHFRKLHPGAANKNGLLKDDAVPEQKPRHVAKRMVAMDRPLFIESIIKLVTYHHLPLACVEWEGLKQLIDPLAAAVEVTINRNNLKSHLQGIADEIRKALAKEMQFKLISLKIDSASRLNRSVLGINVQYALKGKVVIRTIGMIELKERQTASFLKTKILEVLASYGVSIEQIFSVTVDNGANMLAAVRKLKLDLDNILSHQRDVQKLSDAEADLEDEEDEPEDRGQELTDTLSNEFQEQLSLIRCSVHTLQLAILDVVDKKEESVHAITAVAKKCKGIKYKKHFEYHNATLPPVWGQTRWGGIFKMIECFLHQKEFFENLGQEFSELALSASIWTFMVNYEEAFKPLYICTKTMQEHHVTLPEFYLSWLKTVSEISRMPSNPFAPRLAESLTRRLENLKTSRAFQMAIYLDPRLNFLHSKLFSNEEKQSIQNHIVSTWDRISNLRPASEADAVNKTGGSECSQFDDFITDLFGGSLEVSTSTDCSTFVQQLKAQDAEPRQGINFDVWEYWVKREKTHPELFEVAMVVLATPSNQVSVERAFSALALVLSPHRAGLGQEALENILLIKLNKDVFEKSLPTYDWQN